MLIQLDIKNFALIDFLSIEFEKGLNILTGETGAGKSIIIDAVNMAVGERGDRDFIRSGSDKCSIQALFSIENDAGLTELIQEHGIDTDPQKQLIITREIYINGRSISRVNGTIVNQKILRLITQKLIDIHGQHEHQSLLNTDFHMEILDAYGGKEIQDIREELYKKYSEYNLLKKQRSSICTDEMERERKIDLLKFQIQEIESAKLKTGEEEELAQQRNLLANSEKISRIIACLYENLYEGSNHPSVLDCISKSLKDLQTISSIDEPLNNFCNSLKGIQYQLEDLTRDISGYKERIEFDPLLLEEIERRLDLINSLKKKYGISIPEILQFYEKAAEELEFLINSEEKIQLLSDSIKRKEIEIISLCEKLSCLRKNAAHIFEKELVSILKSLNMGKITFLISVNTIKDIFTYKGFDKVEFMISTNAGEPLKPLDKVASGGEISRIMLALKTLLAGIDRIPSIIFDEIDTGISGKTAQIVGEKLFHISKNHQIICITHLPQIAAFADTHFLIEKIEEKKGIITIVTKLNHQQKINEIGRLLGGSITETTLKHAEEIISKARNI